jgi:TetR/AcrR family transcriptional regulator, tetracycline repressor protein
MGAPSRYIASAQVTLYRESCCGKGDACPSDPLTCARAKMGVQPGGGPVVQSDRSAQLSRGRSRGRRLSLDRIVTVTLRLIDEQGMAAASMRGIAGELGVEPMSLYSYVANRDELFDQVVERVVDELSHDPQVRLRPDEGWRAYLAGMAHGVRRYAIGHAHAFPLVATRPSEAPWVNPPLRSLRWIEAFLSGLRSEGFTDEQVLFAYRTFNSFLLGYLLLETSALTLSDPLPGDGSFTAGAGDTDGQARSAAGDPADDAVSTEAGSDPVDASTPVPGGLSPTRSMSERRAIRDAKQAGDHESVVDPVGEVDEQRYPVVHELSEGLAQDHFETEFGAALDGMLDRIEIFVRDSGDKDHPRPS